MPEPVAVSYSRHGKRRWRQCHTYGFARKVGLCGLVLAEIEEATLSLPFGFVQRDDRLFPVAILSRPEGDCLYVGANGNWLGSYIPALLRAYPFRLKRDQEQHLVLHIDESSGLIVDTEEDSEPFFEGNEPSEAIKEMQTFLETLEASRTATAEACAVLQQLNLVQAWPMLMEETDEANDVPSQPDPISRLLRIDQAKLAQLDGSALVQLNRSGALMLALFQGLSERHLALNKVLAKAHDQQRQHLEEKAQDYLERAGEDDTLSFAWED
ncbi:SapC family protein [Halochromatium roseum]|uniref:SapC family protein n=1 Tax=Halochromatium roseum TaxID=391920 RepID=UPI0019120D34|nr:SapC family protein [Halochromatium roseum]